MITISSEAFLRLVRQRHQGLRRRPAVSRERVLRPGQALFRRPEQPRCLATCPACDFVVDAQRLHPVTGLCPRCQDEQNRR